MFGLNQGTIYSILAIVFVSYYNKPIFFKMYNGFNIYNNFNFFKLFSLLMSSQAILEEIENCDNSENIENDENKAVVTKLEPKYEDKFLEDIRKMNNEYIFDEKEKELECEKFNEFFLLLQEDHKKKVNDIKDNVDDIEKKIKKYENDNSDDEFCSVEYCENDEEGKDSLEDKFLVLKNDTIRKFTEEILALEKSLLELNNSQNIEEIKLETQKKARQFVIDERLDKLKNNFIMEKTPLGNVLMLYNNKRGSFEYYSDNTIPYRYLEPVSRKYVKTFNCRVIYFDMEEELKNYERKLEEKKILEEKRVLDEKKMLDEEEAKNKLNNTTVLIAEPKKNVFAKFKSYNKDAGTGHVNMAAPPKNSIPNNKVSDNNNEKVLLKENANRYSYEGKLSNFNFLKKVDRKAVDKKYGMTFADFKRLQEEKKNKQ